MKVSYDCDWDELSVNHMYGYNPYTKRKYLKPEGVKFKSDVMTEVLRVLNETKEHLPKDKELGYELSLRGNWYNKSKASTKIKKRDSNNLVKIVIDGVCLGAEIDDSQFFEESIKKVQSERSGFDIEIYELN